jgi:hypothetical protein
LVAVDIIRLTQKWKDGRPVERRILEAGEKISRRRGNERRFAKERME